MSTPSKLEQLLEQGRDSALLRYALGNEYLKADNPCNAISHLREAVRQNPDHSASWKLLGRALNESGDMVGALAAWREGKSVAERNGDIQAAKEMSVFIHRIEKRQAEER